MKKNALLKDTMREIKNSFGRFVSIFAIVFLGCGFFAGVKATMPDMKDTAEAYFQDNNLMDLRLVSTVGIKGEDIAAVKKLDCVEGVMAGYSKDVFFNNEGKNVVLKIMSYNGTLSADDKNNLNHPVLIEGRMPEKTGECVVDIKLKSDAYMIGNTIDLIAPSDSEKLSDTFACESFEIVGVVTSPLYIGYERDRTSIGNGTVSGYVLINEIDFVSDYYSELFVTLKDCDYPPFSDEYLEFVEKYEAQVKEAFSQSVSTRFQRLYDENTRKIESARTSVETLEEVLGYDIEQLQTIRDETADSVAQLELAAEADNSYFTQGRLSQAKSKLEQLETVLYARISGDSEVLDTFYSQLEQSKTEIASAEEELAAIKDPQYFSYNRYSNSDYGSFDGDSEKIDMISRVFPLFFIIVAALVCLTTMTRMVEEQRTQIGTYKALGYSSFQIASKFLIYGILASVIGSLAGTALGLQVFPRIIYSCYKMLYNIPKINTPFKPMYALGCMGVSVCCTSFAVIYSCYKELSAQPSQLMRPRAPKIGKRVFLEKITFIWNRLDFLAKVTIRNLLRYKKRFVMTIVGVAGCTALILTGFALKHSISAILDLQFSTVFKYGGIAALDISDSTPEECKTVISENTYTTDVMLCNQLNGEVSINKESQLVNIIIPENNSELSNYVNLRNRQSGEEYFLDDSGVIITEKLSKLMNLSIGDNISVDLGDMGSFEAKVTGITENYALHYIYISSALFGSFVEKPEFNMCFFNLTENADTSDFSEQLIAKNQIRGITFLNDNGKNFADSINSLNAIVWLLIACAGALAIVVLYNLANINITERVREIATIKVLGFFDNETSAYIYRENIISAIIGIVIGWAAGIVLHKFVVLTAEVDIVMFDRSVVWWSFLLSALLTMAFTVLINVVLHFKLKGISMVESLKSVE